MLMPVPVMPTRPIASAVVPAGSIADPAVIGPFDNYDAAHVGPGPVDHRPVEMHDTADRGTVDDMAVNDDMPVVAAPAVPVPGLGRSGLDEGSEEDCA